MERMVGKSVAERGKLTLETIDPATAERWLEHHDDMGNRKLNNYHVGQLAGVMLRGEWDPDRGEPIRFDSSGVLVDGQHRLWAVLESERTIRNSVLRGVNRESFREFPELKRAFGLPDYLHMHGVRHGPYAAALLRLLWIYRQRGTFQRQRHHGDIPWPEALGYWQDHPELEAMLQVMRRVGYRPLAALARAYEDGQMPVLLPGGTP